MKGAVDEKLKDNRASCRKNRSSPDQNNKLENHSRTVEQSIEGTSPVTINFIDYESHSTV